MYKAQNRYKLYLKPELKHIFWTGFCHRIKKVRAITSSPKDISLGFPEGFFNPAVQM